MVANVVQTFDSPITSLIDADTFFFFITQDEQLGVSEGTGEDTSVLGDFGFGEDYEGSNGRVFFDGFTIESGEEPFVYNGNSEGITLLQDINPIANETSDPSDFISIGNIVCFTAFEEANDRALYSSDGAPEGTSLVANIDPSTSSSSDFEFLTDFNETLFFIGDSESGSNDLWKSDGTTESTEIVFDF
ncbi:MAG: hypothetical protein ACFCAD_10425 [Pleurocapsa sp.]